MSSLNTLAVQEVEVTWLNNGTSSGSWSFKPGAIIAFSETLALITYRLTPDSSAGATFASTPVVWHQPPTQASNIAVALSADQLSVHFADINVATTGATKSYGFFLQVLFNGVVFQSPDPTIVNTDPPGGVVGAVGEQGSSLAA